MPEYTVTLAKRAAKQLDKLPDNVVAPILSAIGTLSTNPRPLGYIKLKGRNGYRIRVGDYRIIYEIIDFLLVVDVVDLGHRRDVYR